MLHPELVTQLKTWIAGKPDLKPDEPLFPVSGRVPGGTDRKTHKMMRTDLGVAREKWIREARDAQEGERREQSDFLAYQNHDGLFADFHSCRHHFITSLERAGIRPKMAQPLARHSDIRLTLQTYTHVELHDQTAAIRALPRPGDGPISISATTNPLDETGQVSTIVHSDNRRRGRTQVNWKNQRELKARAEPRGKQH